MYENKKNHIKTKLILTSCVVAALGLASQEVNAGVSRSLGARSGHANIGSARSSAHGPMGHVSANLQGNHNFQHELWNILVLLF